MPVIAGATRPIRHDPNFGNGVISVVGHLQFFTTKACGKAACKLLNLKLKIYRVCAKNYFYHGLLGKPLFSPFSIGSSEDSEFFRQENSLTAGT